MPMIGAIGAFSPQQIGTVLGQTLVIIAGAWHFNRSTSKDILDRLTGIEGTIHQITAEQSRQEGRIDMLYVIIGRSDLDPKTLPEPPKPLADPAENHADPAQ